MNEKRLNQYIDLEKWQYNDHEQYQWQGVLSLQDLPRLADLVDQEVAILVKVSLQKVEKIIYWQLQTQGEVWLPCQRCLERMSVSLDYTGKMALLSDESLVALLDDEMDFMLLDEVSDHQKIFLLPMIEDELLMQLPLSPKHEDCEMPCYQHDVSETEVETWENPFAVLASLKQGS